MKRRKPWDPDDPIVQQYMAIANRVWKEACDAFGRGDPSLMQQLRADGEEMIQAIITKRYRHRLGAKLSTEQRLRIASQQKTISASKPRDSRGRFTR